MSHYFAYGSNMNQEQMKERCPNAALLGVASLQDYRLAFTIFSPKRKCGCADVVPERGETVYGLLYELNDTDMEALDRFEGHPIHYVRTSVTVVIDGKTIPAETYTVVTKQEGLKPSPHYLGLIQDAAREHSFPEEYLAMLDQLEAV